jgi:alkanesulfonate monooxygenase SsuD/methylene tetrahydromethanopterin reductase-like flavin-dependent oxidoreductase (luciferase family)
LNYAWLRVDDDRDQAFSDLLPPLDAHRASNMFPSRVTHWETPPGAASDARDAGRAAVAGTPEDCARAVIRLAASGATNVVVWPIGVDPDQQLERFASDVIPLILASAQH